MRTRARVGIATVAGACALAFAGSALAAINPKLVVVAPPATGAGPAVSVTATVGADDDPLAKVQIYAPLGYQLNAPSPGARIGTVKATARAADLGNAVLPLTGTIVAVDPSTLAAQSARCDNVTHAATWVMNLTAAGQTLQIPMFIDQTTGPEAQLAVYKIVICLPPPDVPQGTPGRAQFGAKLLSAQFDMNAFTNPVASGEYRWRSLWTPYTPATGAPNAAGTVEAQSLVRLPTSLTLTVTKKRVVVRGAVKALVTVSGKLTQAGKGVPAMRVTVEAGRSKTTLSRLKSVLTRSDGSYVKKLYIARKTVFMAESSMALQTLGATGCTPSFGPAIRCVSAIVGGNHVLSSLQTATPYRR